MIGSKPTSPMPCYTTPIPLQPLWAVFLSYMLFLSLKPQPPTARLENFYLSIKCQLESNILREILCDDPQTSSSPCNYKTLTALWNNISLILLIYTLFETLNYAIAREGHWILFKGKQKYNKKAKTDPTLNSIFLNFLPPNSCFFKHSITHYHVALLKNCNSSFKTLLFVLYYSTQISACNLLH